MKRQFQLLAVSLVLAAFPFMKALSNNLSISNVSYSVTNGTVTFDLKWDNSWTNTTSNTHNWDAAWVFVKFKSCTEASFVFTHGLISTTESDHTFNGTGGGTTTFQPTKRDGTNGIDLSPDNTGVMLRNSLDPSDYVNRSVGATITLKVSNLPASGTLDLRVYGIEMVYIPPASFYAGDGFADSSTTGSTQCFSRTNTNAPNSYTFPLYVKDTTAFVAEVGGGWCPNSGTCIVSIPFPKGYFPFYMMKYEISQGQYCDFLNAINPFVAGLRYQASNFNQFRYTIQNTGGSPFPFTTVVGGNDKRDRACNWMNWFDFTGYCDWAALRPLSELEYEKAARGTLSPVPYEKAWGNPYNGFPQSGTALSISGTENGTETITNSNANVNANGSVTHTGSGDGLQGPLRCGIFARSSTTSRNQTGGGFYGNMELTGNVKEWYITVRAGTPGVTPPSSAVSSTGISNGNGNLPDNGIHDVASWPSYTDLNPGYANIMTRGGSHQNNAAFSSGEPTNISYRANDAGNFTSRDPYTGGRAGR